MRRHYIVTAMFKLWIDGDVQPGDVATWMIGDLVKGLPASERDKLTFVHCDLDEDDEAQAEYLDRLHTEAYADIATVLAKLPASMRGVLVDDVAANLTPEEKIGYPRTALTPHDQEEVTDGI